MSSEQEMQKFSGLIFVFKKVRFWRSYKFPSVIGTSVVKSYCPNCLYFWGDFLGEGVNDSICVENLDMAPKMTSTIWTFLLQIAFGPEFCFQKGEVLEEL